MLEIIYKKITEIQPYENNPRDNRKAVEPVAESIREFGFRVPIIIDGGGTIVAGHTRYEAAKLLGLKQVPCVTTQDLTPEKIKAFRIIDNKTSEFAKWDKDLLKIELDGLNLELDFEMFDLRQVIDEAGAVEEDDYEIKIPTKPKAKRGDIYKLGNHRLMCGDSTNADDVLQLAGGVEIDLVVTDPPYNVDYVSKTEMVNKKGYGFSGKPIINDNLETDDFVAFLSDAFNAMNMVMKAGAAFYIFHASVTYYDFETALRMNKLQSRQQLIWLKNAFVIGRQDYQWKHEPIIYGWKDGAAHYFINDRTQSTIQEKLIDLDKMKKEEMKAILEMVLGEDLKTSVMKEDKPKRNSEHPTMKPVKLLARLISNSSLRGQNVLDLFGGSGSTLIASEQLDRNCYMMEMDEHYVDVIIDRWEKLTGQKAEKVEVQ